MLVNWVLKTECIFWNEHLGVWTLHLNQGCTYKQKKTLISLKLGLNNSQHKYFPPE